MSTQSAERITPKWTVGDRLRKARSLTGMTVDEFARHVLISPKTVNNYEGDRVKPRALVMEKWAAVTKVSVKWLESGDNNGSTGPDGDPIADTPRYSRTLRAA